MKKQTFTEKQVLELLIDCKNRFGGSELYDQVADVEVTDWFDLRKKRMEKEKIRKREEREERRIMRLKKAADREYNKILKKNKEFLKDIPFVKKNS